MAEPETNYTSWPADRLIARVTELEARLAALTASINPSLAASTDSHLQRPGSSLSGSAKRRQKKQKKDSAPGAFDPSRYSTRYIALKFAYLGQNYNGLEHHPRNVTPLPTIEEVLWRALMKTRLIFPASEAAAKGEVDWSGCEYSKCGRTDKGVSAFGQVVALKVRSSKPVPGLVPKKRRKSGAGEEKQGGIPATQQEVGEDEVKAEKEWHPVRDELPYIQTLNRVLPDDIRVLAWCDPPEGFSARHSCEERQYRYFFTNPAFAPVPGGRGLMQTVSGKRIREGCLDVEAMRQAAKRLEGEHDFRNFCKIDPARQITNFTRRIFHADIQEIDQRHAPAGFVGRTDFEPDEVKAKETNGESVTAVGSVPKLYSFNVNGSAFLYHQVRNMVAILFLVGQGLEQPDVVTELLDVDRMPTRPLYEMAEDAPLVLWDCIFPSRGGAERRDTLNWIRVGDEGGRDSTKQADVDGGDGKFGRNGLMDSLWSVWRQRKIDEVLAGSLIDLAASQGRQTSLPVGPGEKDPRRSIRVFEGGNGARAVGPYLPMVQKNRQEHFEVLNARFLDKKAAAGKLIGQPMDVDD